MKSRRRSHPPTNPTRAEPGSTCRPRSPARAWGGGGGHTQTQSDMRARVHATSRKTVEVGTRGREGEAAVDACEPWRARRYGLITGCLCLCRRPRRGMALAWRARWRADRPSAATRTPHRFCVWFRARPGDRDLPPTPHVVPTDMWARGSVGSTCEWPAQSRARASVRASSNVRPPRGEPGDLTRGVRDSYTGSWSPRVVYYLVAPFLFLLGRAQPPLADSVLLSSPLDLSSAPSIRLRAAERYTNRLPPPLPTPPPVRWNAAAKTAASLFRFSLHEFDAGFLLLWPRKKCSCSIEGLLGCFLMVLLVRPGSCSRTKGRKTTRIG